MVERTLCYLGGVISGREAADQLGGRIRIAQVLGRQRAKVFVVIQPYWCAVGVDRAAESFPGAAHDGGPSLFYGIEAVRGKPLSERAQEVGFRTTRDSRDVDDLRDL